MSGLALIEAVTNWNDPTQPRSSVAHRTTYVFKVRVRDASLGNTRDRRTHLRRATQGLPPGAPQQPAWGPVRSRRNFVPVLQSFQNSGIYFGAHHRSQNPLLVSIVLCKAERQAVVVASTDVMAFVRRRTQTTTIKRVAGVRLCAVWVRAAIGRRLDHFLQQRRWRSF